MDFEHELSIDKFIEHPILQEFRSLSITGDGIDVIAFRNDYGQRIDK